LGIHVEGRAASCFNGKAHHGGHDEHPSLVFYPDSNRFVCFACGVRGDLIDLVRAVRGVTFTQAVRWIESQTGGEFPAGDRPPDARPITQPRVPDAKDIEIYSVLYELTYEIGPAMPAGQYLVGRGLDPDLANRHHATQMGDSDRLWEDLLRRFGRPRLAAAGLVSRSGRFLFSQHQLLFFYFDDGVPLFVQARDITGRSRCKELSLAGLHSPVPYNVDLLRQRPDQIHLCEGCIDTLSALQLGYPAVGVPGVRGFRTEWFAHFKGVGHVVLLFDNDEAGLAQAAELRAQFRIRGIKADASHPSKVKDMNDLLRQAGKRGQL
jgi:DNA primase